MRLLMRDEGRDLEPSNPRRESALSENTSDKMRNRGCASAVSTCATSPLNGASLTLTVLLLSALPICTSTPVFLNPSTIMTDQFLSQIDKGCSSYLSSERPFRMNDALRDFCGIVLEVLRQSQEFSARETSKRFLFHYTKPNGSGGSEGTSTVFHPLLQLIPQLHARRRRRDPSAGSQQETANIQSRGYFVYRPRNGRRSSEYV